MHTLTTKAIITADHTLTVPVPADISPGVHQVTVVIEEAPLAPEPCSLMDWPPHDAVLVEPSNTFRREL